MELPELTRRRKRLLSAANSERNRIQRLLEQANVKVGNVVTDVFSRFRTAHSPRLVAAPRESGWQSGPRFFR
jgi:hypothetical protein